MFLQNLDFIYFSLQDNAKTARITCLVDLYQTELYQDSTDYNELEKSRLLMNFLKQLTLVTGKLLHFWGHRSIVTHISFCSMQDLHYYVHV